MKLSFIFGTRPEAIKLAPVLLMAQRTDGLEVRTCVTGQHESMLAQVLETFSIRPDVNLKLMQSNQSLADFSSRALTAIDGYLSTEKPDMVVVQGDTSTVVCAALAAYYHQIPVSHVEAGLRTGDGYSPFPEEMNRVLVSQLAQFHFAPTEGARENLIATGINPKHITVTGNTIVDALHIANDLIQAHAPVIEGLPEGLTGEASTSRVVLVTGHRRENFGEEFENICEAILSLANKYPEVAFIYPVHLNPNIREPAHRILGKQNNIYLLAPQSYLPFVALLSRSHIVLTDSGGIQEEAPSLCKPVLVMRDTTERPEGIEAGAAKLVGTSKSAIVNAVSHLLEDDAEYTRMAHATNPYGDGRASERIIEVLNAAVLVPA